MREAPRYAAVPPYVANWLLGKVPPQVWREAIVAAQVNAPPGLSRDLERARDQLQASADQWMSMLQQRSGFPKETPGAQQVDPEGKSECSSSDPAGSLSSSEAADLLGVTRQYIGQLVNRGALRGRLVGGRWLIDAASVVELKHTKEQADGEGLGS